MHLLPLERFAGRVAPPSRRWGADLGGGCSKAKQVRRLSPRRPASGPLVQAGGFQERGRGSLLRCLVCRTLRAPAVMKSRL